MNIDHFTHMFKRFEYMPVWLNMDFRHRRVGKRSVRCRIAADGLPTPNAETHPHMTAHMGAQIPGLWELIR